MQFSVTDNKKPITLEATRLSVFRQSKIVEAIDAKQRHYYIFFYKDNFLTWVRPKHIVLNSYIHKAFAHGVLFDGDHPITDQVIQLHHSFSHSRFNQLYNKLTGKYTPQEISLIFTFFDSFISHKQISKLLKKTYYDFRRNGQMLSAYKILKIAVLFDENDTFSNDMISSMQFKSYEEIYKDLYALVDRDPIQLEILCFTDRSTPKKAALLLGLLRNEKRYLDELAVRLSMLNNQFSTDYWSEIKALIRSHFPQEEQQKLLYIIAEQNHHPDLQSDLFGSFLDSNDADSIVRFLVDRSVQPAPNQMPTVATNFLSAKPSTLLTLYPKLNVRLVELFKDEHVALDKIVIRTVSILLTEHTLAEVSDWLAAFRNASISLPIAQRLKKMQLLEDDPDRQLPLGEMYLELDQLDKSIDCFKWEMELKPTDPKPVQLLMNAYRKLGDKTEASTYQQLLVQMQKHSSA
ncbi:tetratricopeptide repeat protein [Radiobacillus sp. PE A8.2]|uniref:tetratricopeptide repeat protein n=1 Tax=Radiobacillus sp. PE A8.2 TaxID=3380349 RepID=UPI00388EBC4B